MTNQGQTRRRPSRFRLRPAWCFCRNLHVLHCLSDVLLIGSPMLWLLSTDVAQCSTTTRCLNPPVAHLPLPASLPLDADLQPGPVVTSRHCPTSSAAMPCVYPLTLPTPPSWHVECLDEVPFLIFNCLIVLKCLFYFLFVIFYLLFRSP